MAKRKKADDFDDDDAEPMLIDVASPTAKALKPLAKRLEKEKAAEKAAKDAKRDTHDKMLAIIEEDNSIKCDAEGVKRIQFDGVLITVKPSGETITVKKAKADDDDED